MLTMDTKRYLRNLAENDLKFGEEKDRDKALKAIKQLDDELGYAPFYTLRREYLDHWSIGANEGLLIHEPGIDCEEVGRGLALFELAARWPYASHRVDALLPPATRSEKATKQSAATMLSRVRAWIADNRDVGLAELLRDVRLSNESGNVMATYRPSADAPTIMTSYL